MTRRNTDFIRLWTEPATRKSNDELYPLVVAGNPNAREQMIQSNIGLIMTEVDRFLIFLPHLQWMQDDLIGYGMIGLVEAVNKIASGGEVEDANPTTFMARSIKRSVGAALEQAQDVRVPTRTKNRKKQQGVEIQGLVKSETIFDDGEEETAERFSYDPRPMQELRRTLDACCETHEEREIMRLREEGYVDREIAEILGLPQTTTYVMRRTLYARFLELTGWKGEA